MGLMLYAVRVKVYERFLCGAEYVVGFAWPTTQNAHTIFLIFQHLNKLPQ